MKTEIRCRSCRHARAKHLAKGLLGGSSCQQPILGGTCQCTLSAAEVDAGEVADA